MKEQARRFLSAALAGLLLAAPGCASYEPMPPPPPPGFAVYRVGAPDQLSVTILPDPPIERTVVVRPDGMISLDLIGDVPAGGRTVDEIAADVEQRIGRFKRDANVSIALVSAQSTGVTVFGEVRGPSSFPLVKETRIAEAIGQVGGETIFAQSKKVKVIRTDAGETAVYVVNLNAIRAGDLTTNIMLRSGDIVYVPPTVFAKIGYALNALLLPFQPLFGIWRTFGTTGF
jgi:polysaccharide export outer membrane protein